MQGSMMQMPLLISSLIRHAERHHGDVQIVSRRTEGDIHRYCYRDLGQRARQLARALATLGIKQGDRVATLAWNGYRHLELYYGVSGSGAVLHTINPRLLPEQIAWMVANAADKILFFDRTFLPIIEAIAPKLASVQQLVLLAARERLPSSTDPAYAKLPNLIAYEDLLAAETSDYEWPQFDENTASSMCYTSGTTGHPKGVLYSHRSTVLHAMAAAMPDALNISARDAILPVVPMFHVNAWGLPYAAPMVGAKLVLPGPHLDGKSLYELFEAEKVTCSAGVPTVWQGLLAHTEAHGLRFSTMRRTVIGGSACPPAMIRLFQDKYQVQVLHAWGMTEMSPLGTVCTFTHQHADWSEDARVALQSKQGRALFGVDLRIVDSDGADLPWNGEAFGDLLVRGHWVMREYFNDGGNDPLVHEADGRDWFPTGDVATVDASGYMQITDRSKDLIKSGGEWISSIEIENVAMSHPQVAMAACIAVAHPKWDERPLLVVVRRPDGKVSSEELLAHYAGRVAKWQIPDDVVFVDAIPLGATGKMLKARLREQFHQHQWPEL